MLTDAHGSISLQVEYTNVEKFTRYIAVISITLVIGTHTPKAFLSRPISTCEISARYSPIQNTIMQEYSWL